MTQNALTSLWGEQTSSRAQTVFTPQPIVDAICETFDGQITLDPCWAPGALTEPKTHILAPWKEIAKKIDQLAREEAKKIKDYSCDIAYEYIYDILSGKQQASKLPACFGKAAKLIRAKVADSFYDRSGHNFSLWEDGTYINPNYGERGPETILASFKDWCESFRKCDVEVAMLCPVRPHRAWWQTNILLAADNIVYLKPVTFVGHKGTFPAPLCVPYKGPNGKRLAKAFSKLGVTVQKAKLESIK